MYCHWATMSLDPETALTVTPFNMLPIERENPDATPEQIDQQRIDIKNKILDKINYQLEQDLQNDPKLRNFVGLYNSFRMCANSRSIFDSCTHLALTL